VKDKVIPESALFDLLTEYGLPKTIPILVHAPIHTDKPFFSRFDWHPMAAPLCPTVWHFHWKGKECSITGGGAVIYIRVHDMSPGVGETVIQELMDELYSRYIPPKPHRLLSVYQHQSIPGRDPQWSSFGTRVYRDMETIYLDEELKKTLVLQLQKFLISSDLYDRYGVIWKRVHLFHGPPGSGKSSMVAAMASKFEMNIAKLEISPDLDSRKLALLFQQVPEKTMVLIEDVDALFVDRKAETMISFSSLLNCLDGIATKRGLVVFMTTNHVQKLDSAFLRPGRVDCSVEFKMPGLTELRKALKTLGEQYEHEHEDYLKANPNLTIAAVQQHLFNCVMAEKTSIL
jgi:hypothetical protein